MGTNGRQCVTCDENDQRTRRRLMEKNSWNGAYLLFLSHFPGGGCF
jgi:hypothetical protein